MRTLRTTNAIPVAADGFGTGRRVPAGRPFGAARHQCQQRYRKSCRRHGRALPRPVDRGSASGLSASSTPAGLNSKIMSVAAISPTDEWMLITRTDNHGSNVSAVYHLVGTERLESADLADSEKSFAAKWIVARSDTDVWVIGSARGALEAWHYDGSSWTDHPPTRYSYAAIDAAALGSDGILYLAGSNGHTRKGIILSYDGSRWADLSPANPPSDYQALAVTADGTAHRGRRRAQATAPCRRGRAQRGQPSPCPRRSIRSPGSASPVAAPCTGSVRWPGTSRCSSSRRQAAGPPPSLTRRRRIRPPRPRARSARSPSAWTYGYSARTNRATGGTTRGSPHDDSGFVAARRRMSQVATPRSGQPCWSGQHRGQRYLSGHFPAPRGVPGAGVTQVNHPCAAAHATRVATALVRPGGG